MCICTHQWAASREIVGKPKAVFIKVVNKKHEQVDSRLYEFDLVDNRQVRHKIRAMGLMEIGSQKAYHPYSDVKNNFPKKSMDQLKRKAAVLDILLWMDVIGIQPTELKTVGNQRMVASKFRQGKILTGVVACEHAVELSAMAYQVVTLGSYDLPEGTEFINSRAKIPPFIEQPDHDVDPLLTCRDCKARRKNCKACNFRTASLSQAEMDSVEGMQSSVKYDESNQQIIVAYPFTPKAYVQPDNFKQVQSIQQTIEKRVYSQGLDEEYNAEMSCMIEAGCVSKMTEEERKDQSYGVHYMPHFAVLNPESKSTKLRVVVDSACRNKYSKLSFNDLVRPVPNSLNDITDIQLRWRSFLY